MLKKAVFAVIVSGLLAAQGASAMSDHSPFPPDADGGTSLAPLSYAYESTPAAVITAVPPSADMPNPAPNFRAERKVPALADRSDSPFPASVD